MRNPYEWLAATVNDHTWAVAGVAGAIFILAFFGLSMVTKLAPLRLASLMMGVWSLINFVATWLAGIIGSFAESLGELSIFGGLAGTLFFFAIVLWTLSGTLVRWMHGAEDIKH